MHRECRERSPHHRLQNKPLVSDPGMHHGICVTHMPWCMLGWLTHGVGENIPGIPGACATRSFTYLVRGPWNIIYRNAKQNYIVYRSATQHENHPSFRVHAGCLVRYRKIYATLDSGFVYTTHLPIDKTHHKPYLATFGCADRMRTSMRTSRSASSQVKNAVPRAPKCRIVICS